MAYSALSVPQLYKTDWDEAAQNSLQPATAELFEVYADMPSLLGSGYDQYIELHPQLELKIFDHEYCDNYIENRPASNHPLQFSVFLSGRIQDEERNWISERNTVISGGGIQREMKIKHFSSSRMVGIDIEMTPDLLATFFPGKDGGIPPELKLLVGVSDRTLRRGFRELFGITVFGYLTQMRMEKAEQFLRESNMTVAEVANLVVYTHLGHFAAAFKRKYGITPRECFLGKKSISGL